MCRRGSCRATGWDYSWILIGPEDHTRSSSAATAAFSTDNDVTPAINVYISCLADGVTHVFICRGSSDCKTFGTIRKVTEVQVSHAGAAKDNVHLAHIDGEGGTVVGSANKDVVNSVGVDVSAGTDRSAGLIATGGAIYTVSCRCTRDKVIQVYISNCSAAEQDEYNPTIHHST